jgi:hypothetical protein
MIIKENETLVEKAAEFHSYPQSRIEKTFYGNNSTPIVIPNKVLLLQLINIKYYISIKKRTAENHCGY